MHDSSTDTPYSTSAWPQYPYPLIDSLEEKSQSERDNKSTDTRRPTTESSASVTSAKNRSNSVISTSTSGSMVDDPTLFDDVEISLPADAGGPGMLIPTYVTKLQH